MKAETLAIQLRDDYAAWRDNGYSRVCARSVEIADRITKHLWGLNAIIAKAKATPGTLRLLSQCDVPELASAATAELI